MRKLLLSFSLFLLSPAILAESVFPGRETYLNVAVIEMADLRKKYDQVAIIDVCSPPAFSV